MVSDEPFRIRQEHGEPFDIFVIKAFVIALQHTDDNHLRALIHYISDRGFAELVKRRREKEITA